jgi:hypothetical protein
VSQSTVPFILRLVDRRAHWATKANSLNFDHGELGQVVLVLQGASESA